MLYSVLPQVVRVQQVAEPNDIQCMPFWLKLLVGALPLVLFVRMGWRLEEEESHLRRHHLRHGSLLLLQLPRPFGYGSRVVSVLTCAITDCLQLETCLSCEPCLCRVRLFVAYLLGLLAMVKCSIWSYQCDN